MWRKSLQLILEALNGIIRFLMLISYNTKEDLLSSNKSGFLIFQNCISDGNLRPKSGLFASANIATMMCPENIVTVAWNILTTIIETNCNHRNHHHHHNNRHHHYQFHNHLLSRHRAFLDSATTTPVETSRRVKSHLDLRMIVQFQFLDKCKYSSGEAHLKWKITY